MSGFTYVILFFSVIGAVDNLLGNRFGIGKEFERAFSLFAPMALSMLGMLVISPALGVALSGFFEWFYSIFRIDPSIIPASLFANDMGGTSLAQLVCKSKDVGAFNAYIVSSMMGCAVSFTLPFALNVVKKELYKEMFLGILCGIVTIPIGCLVAGLMCDIGFCVLLFNLLPLLIFSIILGIMLMLFKKICIKLFWIFGHFIRFVAMVGLICAIFTFLTNVQINQNLDSLKNAALVCVNACVTLSGALPLMHLVSKLLNNPLKKIGSKLEIDSISAVSFLATLVTNVTTFGVMDKMNKKGVVLNAAFAVSASFALGGHLSFTMAFDTNYIVPMVVGKIVSGIFAVGLAWMVYGNNTQKL